MTAADPGDDGRCLSRSACRAVADRLFAMASGGGETRLRIDSGWRGNVRWARNDIATGGDTRQTEFDVTRSIRGAAGRAATNSMADDALRACVRRAEGLIHLSPENPDDYPDSPVPIYPHSAPVIWFDRTVDVDETVRTAAVGRAVAPAEAAGVQSAGYLEVAALGYSILRTQGVFRYYPFTTVRCSLTVRDPATHSSGWAGVDWNDWSRIDVDRLGQTALEKCLRSRNPVAVEPGRFTAILEPQAACDLISIIPDEALHRVLAETGRGPFADPERYGYSRIGQRVVDPRITMSVDPMDPDCGFVPFDWNGEPYTAVKWIDQGVLKELAYDRHYGLKQLGTDRALPNSRAFRLSGGTSSLDEMIAATTRGLLVTRLNNVRVLDINSLLCTGTTRDGLWLIEHGKISKSVKNFRFTESPMFILNNIEALGAPQRVFRPDAPAIVPPIMVRDFSFTSLIDAV